MQEVIRLGDESDILEVNIKVSFRAKRISIRIAPKSVELILPHISYLAAGKRFLLEKELFLRNKLRQTKPINNNSSFATLCILDKTYKIITDEQNASQPVTIEQEKILISKVIAENKIKDTLAYHLKKFARKEIEILTYKWAEELDIKFNKISIKDTSSRWGSCSSSGTLSFSWRLIFAPLFVLNYVIIHELCHIREMNHSNKFWNLVAKGCPEYKNARDWLKKNGRKLHQILEI